MKKKDGRKNNGGKRPGAGRPSKPKHKHKKPITIYVDPNIVKNNKKKKAVKELIISTLEDSFKKD